jgi:L-lactate permease
MQTVAADKIGLNPVQMAAANETAGCIGHIISTASMVVAAVAVGGDGKSITHIVKAVLPFGLGVGVMFALWNTLVAYAFPDFIPTSPYGG